MFDTRRARTAGEQAALDEIGRAEQRWPGYLATARRTTLNAHYTDPAIIAPVWELLAEVGIHEGHLAWEPGAGTGLWLSDAGAVAGHGVELDPVSAAIGNHLIPRASRIDNVNLSAARLPSGGPGEGGYDLAVGNVPFASVVVNAPDNPHALTLHNYALVKAARMVRPGGYLAVLTSRYTLDGAASPARAELATLTNLVAAVRLPTDAHWDRAGTAVVTDLLVMHRPATVEELTGWPAPAPVEVDGTTVLVSGHYVEHPDRVLGTYALGGMRSGEDLQVLHPGARDGGYLPELRQALVEVAATAPRAAPQGAAPAVNDRPLGDVEQLPLGSIVQIGAGMFRRLTSTGREEHRVPGTQRAELEALCGLRDRVRDVLAADATGDPGGTAKRAALNEAYDRYTDRYGPLNRFGVRAATRATVLDTDDNAQGGVVATQRVFPPLGGFRTDPGWWSVAALEVFDDDTQISSKAPILAGPVARTASYPVHVDDPTVAVQVLLARDGAVTVPAVAELAGLDEAAVEGWLGDAVYRDPATAELVPAAGYLSGLVGDKLDVARDAAATDPSFRRHVEALETVVPAWIRPEEITPRLGASWVPASDLRQFVVDELGLEHAEVSHVPELASWTINAGGYSAENEFTYAVEGRGRKGVDLVEDLANQRPTRITRDVEGRRVLDVEATAAAAAKRGQLEDLYAGWLWSDPERSDRLAATYNARFNAWVEPRWSGDSLRFDGLATGFQPRQHQVDAVARILGDRDRGTLLAHTVGAGKTAVMAMSAMELRRLGIATGPVGIVVPNSMLQQFGREFAQLYPQANILAADDANFSRDQRREFTARAASGAYDIVLFTHTSFTALPASPATIEAATTREVDSYRRALSAVEGEGPSRTQARTVKQIETAIAGLEVKLEKLADRARHDTGSVAFEELGLGHLMVDEAHLCKNLSFPTRIDAVQVKESGRARDLLIKVDWMREHRGPGSVTFSTATPVTNQISEMWVFQRFLDPGGLQRAGVEHFDAWAANFAATITAVEIAPSGAGFRAVSRFARFSNVPELSRAFRGFADVRTAEQLQLPRPAVAGGKATTITIPVDEPLQEFMAHLVERSERVKASRNPEKGEDNVLAITSDGRVGALDMRLASRSVGFGPVDGPSPKVARAATEIAARYHQHRDRQYLTDSGEAHPVSGAAQIVFCDHGVVGNTKRDVYEDLVEALGERGVPPERVAAVQSAKTHGARAELFRRVRDGQVSVLIGSTASMGVGVNVQTRLVASHILTPPWRPDEVEQAEGRILRQGNQHPEVELLRYVSEGSYDGYSWQTIERKARFVGQIMTAPDALGRDLVDESAVADEYAVLKAIATGDPRILEAAQLESRVTALERSRTVHERSSRRLAGELEPTRRSAERNDAAAAALGALLERSDDSGLVLAHQDGTTRGVAAGPGQAAALGEHLAERVGAARFGDRAPQLLATLDGIPLTMVCTADSIEVAPEGNLDPTLTRRWDRRDIRFGSANHQGVGQAITNLTRGLPRRHGQLVANGAQEHRRAADIETRLATPFAQAGELAELRGQLGALQAELMPDDEPDAPPAPAPPAAPAPARYKVPPSPNRHTRSSLPPSRSTGFDR